MNRRNPLKQTVNGSDASPPRRYDCITTVRRPSASFWRVMAGRSIATSLRATSQACMIVWLGANAAASGSNTPFVIPLNSDPPPAVDGQLNEWLNRPGVIVLDRREQVTWGGNTWKSTADLSARAWVAWRPHTLYLAASVMDNQLRQSQRGHDLWRGDHVMLFLDVAPDDEPQRDVFGRGQFQIGFSPGNLGCR